MSDLIIRQGQLKDVDEIAKLEIECFPDPWSRVAIRDEIEKNENSLYIVAEVDGKVVGYAGIWYVADEGQITNVAVSNEYRRRHIGEAIIYAMLDYSQNMGIKAFTLEVRVSNLGAQKLYEKFGFENSGIRPGYYLDGEDAMIMWLIKE